MGVSTAFFERFKKVIALVGSDREGERHTAADRAFALCRDNDLSILEALDGAFGMSSGDEDLQRQIEELESDNRKLAEAVELLNAQQGTVTAGTGKAMVVRLWSYSQVRLLAMLVLAGVAMLAIPELEYRTESGAWWYLPFAVNLCLIFWNWAVLEYARRGLGSMVLKGVMVAIAILVAIIGQTRHPDDGFEVLLAAALLTITNGPGWLAKQLATSDDEVLVKVRSWFA